MRDYIKSIVSVARRRCDELHGRPDGSACRNCLVATAVRPREAHAEAQQHGAAASAQQDAKRLAERIKEAHAWYRHSRDKRKITRIMAYFGVSYAELWTWLHGDPFAKPEVARARRAAGDRVTAIMAHFGINYETVWAWLHGSRFPQAKAVTS